jgi:hypothetical protein
MTDIKRLHEVHYQYPNVPRRGGKTTYCFDRLLRTAQLEELEHICYVSNTMQNSMNSKSMFIKYLEDNDIYIKRIVKNLITIYNCKITFESIETFKNKQYFDSVVYDLY